MKIYGDVWSLFYYILFLLQASFFIQMRSSVLKLARSYYSQMRAYIHTLWIGLCSLPFFSSLSGVEMYIAKHTGMHKHLYIFQISEACIK